MARSQLSMCNVYLQKQDYVLVAQCCIQDALRHMLIIKNTDAATTATMTTVANMSIIVANLALH